VVSRQQCGDALRRLATAATYLYQDGARYWFSTQATVTKIAEDRAEQLIREPEKVAKEIEGRSERMYERVETLTAFTHSLNPARKLVTIPTPGLWCWA